MIYYDVTEGRENTRLSKSIQDLGQPVIGLEPRTGADLLITEMDGLGGNLNVMPGKAQLPQFLENSFLVQRKSGGDLLNSIPDLHNIIWRMRVNGDKRNCRYWLLCCGDFDITDDNMVVCEGRTTGWHWSSMQGALEMWGLFGGHISMNPTDEACALTLERWNRNIDKWAEDVKKLGMPRVEPPKMFLEARPWRATIQSFPNCGEIMSDNIAQKNERLCDSLVWMSQKDSFGVPGIGEKTLQGFRSHLGLNDNEAMAVIRNEPTIHE